MTANFLAFCFIGSHDIDHAADTGPCCPRWRISTNCIIQMLLYEMHTKCYVSKIAWHEKVLPEMTNFVSGSLKVKTAVRDGLHCESCRDCNGHARLHFKHVSLHITGTSQWAQWRLKSTASRLFAQPFVQVRLKENIRVPRHWPWWGEFTDDRWTPRTKGQ